MLAPPPPDPPAPQHSTVTDDTFDGHTQVPDVVNSSVFSDRTVVVVVVVGVSVVDVVVVVGVNVVDVVVVVGVNVVDVVVVAGPSISFLCCLKIHFKISS